MKVMRGWLGRMDTELDEDDEFVFDDDILTWGDVAIASGVGESSQRTRATSTSRATPRVSKSSNVLQLVDEEDASSDDTNRKTWMDINPMMKKKIIIYLV